MAVAAIPAIVMVAAAAVAAAGTAYAAVSASNAAKYNAQVEENQADYARQAAQAQAEAHQRDVSRQLGQIRANYGASGVDIEGSPLDVLGESARMGELDRLTILNQGENQAIGLQNSARLDRYQATTKLVGGGLSATGTLLGGIAGAFGGAAGAAGQAAGAASSAASSTYDATTSYGYTQRMGSRTGGF